MIAEWEARGNVITPYVPPQPTPAHVNIERDRRIEAGAMFDISGYGESIYLTGRLRDQIVYQERMAKAQRMVEAGDMSTLILRDGGNVNRHLTPAQMIELVSKAADWVEQTMLVSWNMKDGARRFPRRHSSRLRRRFVLAIRKAPVVSFEPILCTLRIVLD